VITVDKEILELLFSTSEEKPDYKFTIDLVNQKLIFLMAKVLALMK
jgi:hypothetical protein